MHTAARPGHTTRWAGGARAGRWAGWAAARWRRPAGNTGKGSVRAVPAAPACACLSSSVILAHPLPLAVARLSLPTPPARMCVCACVQGARLTAYELVHDGLPSTLICDSAAAALMASGRVDAVVVGADRIAANGDTGAAAC